MAIFVCSFGTVTNVVSDGNSRTYLVTVAGLSGANGAANLDLSAGQNIEDELDQVLSSTVPTVEETYIVDHTIPIVASITRSIPGSSLLSGTSAMFQIAFSEGVVGLDAADSALTAVVGSVTATIGPRRRAMAGSPGRSP